jgi:NADPH-dependent curcumin reductase CurA
MYCLDKPDDGPRPQPYLLVNRALMKGFIITDYAPRFSEGVKQLAQWLAEGKLKYAESVVEGFENTPQAFIGLFSGENLGKQIVKVADSKQQTASRIGNLQSTHLARLFTVYSLLISS